MSNQIINKERSFKKWGAILENMGVDSVEKREWMSEMAEYQHLRQGAAINENAYANASNVKGMGPVVNAIPSAFPGTTVGGTAGSGDIAQNLLPVSMKIAAQTIGLELVAVKPSAGPKIDLVYLDFKYDNTQMGDDDERPQLFKFNDADAAVMTDVTTKLKAALYANGIVERQGGLYGGRLFIKIDSTITNASLTDSATIPASKKGVLEFLGFSRIDNFPIFRAFRQFNTAHTAVTSGVTWGFDADRNTFAKEGAMTAQLKNVVIYGASASSATLSSATADKTITLLSTMEDHIPGFVTNFAGGPAKTAAGQYPMTRDQEGKSYSGIIAPEMSTKTVHIGTVEVSSALRLDSIEDIKASTGIDIVQKMESVLVNELSQAISKQIVDTIFHMGDLNRASAPKTSTGVSRFDLNTAYAVGPNGLGGETTHAVQRKLVTKILNASNYIATEGRVGPAQFLVTNGALAATLVDISPYTVNPVIKSKLNTDGQLYPLGTINGITVYVDPYQKYDDNRIVLGRKNNADMPGVIFIPYLMAQSVTVTSEATFGPRMLLRSRYAISEVGYFPHKQYMTITVTDENMFLN